MIWIVYIIIGLAAGLWTSSTPSVTIKKYTELFNTFLYGPMKMYLGYQIYTHKWMSEFFAAVLMIGGAMTTSQNLKQYLAKPAS